MRIRWPQTTRPQEHSMRVLMGLLVISVGLLLVLAVGAVWSIGLWILAVAVAAGVAVYLLGTAAIWLLDRLDR